MCHAPLWRKRKPPGCPACELHSAHTYVKAATAPLRLAIPEVHWTAGAEFVTVSSLVGPDDLNGWRICSLAGILNGWWSLLLYVYFSSKKRGRWNSGRTRMKEQRAWTTGEEIARRHAGAGQRERTISVESEKQYGKTGRKRSSDFDMGTECQKRRKPRY